MSIDEMFNIQQMLTDSIDSILDVGPLVLQNAILLHSVIDTQKQIIAAAKGTQDAISASLEANARLMKKNASDATEFVQQPNGSLNVIREVICRSGRSCNVLLAKRRPKGLALPTK